MKLDSKNKCAVCEQCGALGPTADTVQEMMRKAVQEAGWGYAWEHIHEFDHVAHFYCARCKTDFDVITQDDIPT